MSKGKESSFEVKDFYQKTKDSLKLNPVSGGIGFSRKINQSEPGQQAWSIQVWGKKDIQVFESLSSHKRKELAKSRLKENPFCIILTDSLAFSKEIREEARKRRIALFSSEFSQKKCWGRVRTLFPSFFPNQITMSGGLVQISGVGVLIVGDSGIGKSESVLELISRGYRFVCDDVVKIKKISGKKLAGAAPSLTHNFMEIRGLGIINIREIFGLRAICEQSEIDLVVELRRWQRGKEYDRLGLRFPEDHEILGTKIPLIRIPVAPGRNIATLIEVASKVLVLRRRGYNATTEIIRKVNRALNIS